MQNYLGTSLVIIAKNCCAKKALYALEKFDLNYIIYYCLKNKVSLISYINECFSSQFAQIVL